MKRYRIIIDEEALADLKNATRWYNGAAHKLGDRFQREVKQQISGLKAIATGYALRHKSIHCMPIKRFPYMVHFTVDETNRTVTVWAIIHTSRHPDVWDEKTKKS